MPGESYPVDVTRPSGLVTDTTRFMLSYAFIVTAPVGVVVGMGGDDQHAFDRGNGFSRPRVLVAGRRLCRRGRRAALGGYCARPEASDADVATSIATLAAVTQEYGAVVGGRGVPDAPVAFAISWVQKSD